jgi:hypothetical protein
MKIKVYAYFDKDEMYDKGLKAGLTVQAADFFSYFEECKVELDVDKNGLVVGAVIQEF